MKKKTSSCEFCFQFLIIKMDTRCHVLKVNFLFVNVILGEDPPGRDLDLKMTKSDSKYVSELVAIFCSYFQDDQKEKFSRGYK